MAESKGDPKYDYVWKQGAWLREALGHIDMHVYTELHGYIYISVDH